MYLPAREKPLVPLSINERSLFAKGGRRTCQASTLIAARLTVAAQLTIYT